MDREEFVDLDRRFEPVDSKERHDSDTLGPRMFLPASIGGLSWTDVLTHRVVVVLGRAGSGKTRELRHQRERLAAAGEAAFYVRLEALTKGSLEDALGEKGDPGILAEFRKWKRGRSKAVFFLDALDEARLPRGRNGIVLDEALAGFKQGLGKARSRASLILSTRGSEWHDRTDRPKLEDMLTWLTAKEDDADRKAAPVTSVIPSIGGGEWQEPADRPKFRDLLTWWRAKPEYEAGAHAEGMNAADAETVIEEDLPAANTGTNPAELKVLALTSLTRTQLMRLAGARGIDAEEFVSAIETAKAVVLAQTPLEAGMLINVWKGNLEAGRPGASGFENRRSLFERAIAYVLRPRPDDERRSDLSHPIAMAGLRALAAAGTFADKRDFTITGQAEDCLDPHSILGALDDDWTDASIRQLFSYAFFDPVSAGRIRFAAREIQDFLAAEFFDQAIDRLGGNLEPLSPLIGRFADQRIVPPGLLNFFGWLATMNPAVRRLITDIQPTLLMETGDPSLYSLQERADALISHARQYETRVLRGERFYRDDLKAFAHPDLAPTVAGLLSETASPELRENLIELARHGEMASISGTICNIACNRNEPRRVRTEAHLALRDFGPGDMKQRVRDSLGEDIAAAGEIDAEEAPTWNALLLSGLCFTAPGTLSIRELTGYLEYLAREPRNYASGNGMLASDLVQAAQAALPGNWLGALLDLVISPTDRTDNGLPVALPSHRALLEPLADLLLARLPEEAKPATGSDVLKAIELFCGLSHRDGSFVFSQKLENIASALRAAPGIKLALLRARRPLVNTERLWAYEAVAPLALSERYDGQNIWTADDVLLALEQASTSTDAEEVRAWYAIAESVTHEAEPISDRIAVSKRLHRFARRSHDPVVRKRAPDRPRLYYRFKFWLVHAGGWRKIKYILRENASAPWRRIRRAWRIRQILKLIRSGKHLNYLQANMFEATRNDRAWSIQAVLDHIGKTDGRAARKAANAGYRAVWRSFDPARLTDPDGWAVADIAYAGLELDRRSGNLRLDAAETACWCAVTLLAAHRKVPDLAGRYLPGHGTVIRDFLEAPLRQALASKPHPQDIPHRLISSLAYGPELLRAAAAPLVADLILEGAVRWTGDLAYLLSILLHTGETGRLGSAFIRRRFAEAAAEGQDKQAWAWLELLFRTEPETAMGAVAPWTAHVWPEDSNSPLLGFLAQYGSLLNRSRDEERQQLDALQSSASALGFLVRLAWCIAPPETDLRHEDVYTPGIRDRAGDQRRYWTEQLVALGSEAGYREFLRLAELPELSAQQDVFLYHAERLARQGASRPVPSDADLPRLMSGLRAHPRTRDEFAAYVASILEALLERFANSSHDEARAYRKPDGEPTERNEADFRNWLSARLEETGRDAFSVTREPEAARENRTDILVTARRADLGCVVVEVKLADRSHWPGHVLVRTLETQVRDKYLLEADKHAGVLVLLNTRGPTFRKRVDGALVGFEALVAACKAHSETLGSDKRYFVLGKEI